MHAFREQVRQETVVNPLDEDDDRGTCLYKLDCTREEMLSHIKCRKQRYFDRVMRNPQDFIEVEGNVDGEAGKNMLAWYLYSLYQK